MRFLRWLGRTLRGIRDRILLVAQGLFGPPLEALQRVLGSLRERIDHLIELLLEWWRRIWQKSPTGEGEEPESLHGGPGMPLLATAIMGATCYLVPYESLFGVAPALVAAVAIVVWWASLALLLRACRGEPHTLRKRWLDDVQRRAGLVGFERFGVVVSLVALIAAVENPSILPLAIASLVSFLIVLGRRYEERVLGPPRPDLGPAPDITDPDGWVERSFHWSIDWEQMDDAGSVTVPINVDRYQRQKDGNTMFAEIDQIVRWVDEGGGEEVDAVARRMVELSSEGHMSSFREICHVLAFVQAIPYSRDIHSAGHEDYWRYPIETMYDETGDCEDSSILATAVLARIGHGVVLIDAPGHIAIGVRGPDGIPGTWLDHRDGRYFYCETTDVGWKVGELPPGIDPKVLRVIPLGAVRGT